MRELDRQNPMGADVARSFRLLKPELTAGGRCDRCGAEGDSSLSVVRFEAARLRSRRTVCDFCVGVLFEAFIETPDPNDDTLAAMG